MMRRVSSHIESWTSLIPFRISNQEWREFACVVCEIEQDSSVGYGEGHPVYYLGESPESMLEQLYSIVNDLGNGASRDDLQQLLPPGGARMAADAALWDLESQLTGTSAWQTAGVAADTVETVFTIGLEPEPEDMAAKAADATDLTLFKVKLGGDRPVERIRAIRNVRPDARLVVDANQGWSFTQLQDVAPQLKSLGVQMIEQPLPRGADAVLEDYEAPLPLCSDESCQHLGELDDAAKRYQMINIKLDKTGGLTHALVLAKAAREKGLGLMVGCMGGTSLSMAPAHVIAQLCEYIDIDGPLLLKNDRIGGLIYDHGRVSLPAKRFWGTPT